MKISTQEYRDIWKQSYVHERLKHRLLAVSSFALATEHTQFIVGANKYNHGDDPKINFLIGVAAAGIALVTGIKAVNHWYEENRLVDLAYDSELSDEFIEE